MQELPSYIPPGGMFDERGQLTFDPNGPVGRLVDPTYERQTTLGQLAQLREPPTEGWILDYSQGTAIPVWDVPGQLPPAFMAVQTGRPQNDTAAQLLLLL